ncbi:MAG: hypothetical protein DRO15_04030 [Thermoprotei archaeon]|mgnify:CR=1 FL=1|nr:MAG: hypothetical protein DRO15_04030 [Thermoprotei archaeon]
MFRAGPRYIGPIPHPAIGIRLPDIVLLPILRAFKDYNVVGGFMLSYNRETAPRRILDSLDPKLLFYGHTGTSISEYITKATEYSLKYGVPIELEADHVSLMASPERAIKRIAGAEFEYGLSDEEISESLRYIDEEFKEVKKAGGVNFVTIDTCELVDLRVDSLSNEDVLKSYEEVIDEETRRRLEREYLDKTFTFISPKRIIRLSIKRETLARLALKFFKSINYVRTVYEIISKHLELHRFGIEVSLDEIPQVTKPEELFFYLNELRHIGIYPDFIAPNIGFKKREDYTKDLNILERTIESLHIVAQSFGTLLSIHSGSGSHPYSDKGIGVWERVKEATKGMVKYKVSGVYIQLLLEIMSQFPEGSRPKAVYSEIFDTVYEYLRNVIKKRTELYSKHLEKMLSEYEEMVSKDPNYLRNPRANFFRHFFFLFQCLRNERGVRYLRNKVLEVYEEYEDLRRIYTREAYELTRRLITKLGFENNILKYRLEILKT